MKFLGVLYSLFFCFKTLKIDNLDVLKIIVILVQKLSFHNYLLLNSLSSYHNIIC
jgi:hypothetical protein